MITYVLRYNLISEEWSVLWGIRWLSMWDNYQGTLVASLFSADVVKNKQK